MLHTQTTISNGVLELTLERNSSGAALTSLRDAATGAATRFSADMVYYEGTRHPTQPPWVVRPSGQYIFHPRGPAQPVRRRSHALLSMCSHRSCRQIRSQMAFLQSMKLAVAGRCRNIESTPGTTSGRLSALSCAEEDLTQSLHCAV